MKIGILQSGHSPDALIEQLGDYGDLFTAMLADDDLTFKVFSVVDGIFPSGATAADGWLITGSRYGAYEDHHWIPPLEDLIREIHARALPMIGVCFGHQIIAQALGGKVEKFQGGWTVGRTEYEIEYETEYDMGGQKLAVNAWHQDQVTRRPDGARVLARNETCENAVLAYGDVIWTIQPHPEMSSEFVDGLIRFRGRGLVPDHLLDAAQARNELPNSNADIATLMIDFFKKKRL
ncbi:MAG: type 1 glutamine amidotransferase [Rhodobacteraceae bacterium]|nr:type 1 glutamine amidotransferase [Paracoccaceae bacterium]